MTPFKEIEDRLELHLRTVDELISFDRIILDVCIDHINALNGRLKAGPFNITNPSYLAEGTLKVIQNVRDNNSLRKNYLSMFNSCLVLQVSYFTSTMDDIFKHIALSLFTYHQRTDLDPETLRQKNDINFQNMMSTVKTFKKYLDIDIDKSSICNTIILAQSSRHALVHSLGIADSKFISQITAAKPRDIKHTFIPGERIQYSSSELEYVKLAMLTFVTNLFAKVTKRYSIE